MRLAALILLVLLAWTRAWAQSTLTQNLSTQKPPVFSGNLGLSYNSNLYQPESRSNAHNSSGSADLTVNYRVKDANIIRAYFGGFKEFTDGQEWRPNDGFVGWVNNSFWTRKERYSLGQQVRLNIPYSKESRKRDTKVAGISVVPVVSVILAPTLTFIYQPQLIHNLHTYTVNQENTNNTQWAVNQTFVLSWSMSEKFYLQGVYVHGMGWNYHGAKKDDVYQVGGELGYSISNAFIIAGGWNNSGGIRAYENGNDQTVRIFDNNTSTVYAALYWIF